MNPKPKEFYNLKYSLTTFNTHAMERILLLWTASSC